MRELSPRDFYEIEQAASKAASRYARVVFWADKDDLRQEAMLAAVEATKRWYDPQTGVPVSAYAWRACVLHLRKWCWRNSAPVSASDHSVQQLRGLHRRSWDAPAGAAKGSTPGPSLIDSYAGPVAVEESYYQAEWHALVREQVEFVLQDGMPAPDSEIARRVILGDEPPATVATAAGMPAERVWRIARRARVLLAENEMLFNFWRER